MHQKREVIMSDNMYKLKDFTKLVGITINTLQRLDRESV
jgi:DNA-binding Xre family transcriptional regulator